MTLTGNTLLRKDAIPSAWKKYKMRINGADDELLFIGMLLEKKKFMTISNITFFHVITGENQSANLGKMICSSLEAYDILIREYPQHTKQLKIFYNRKKIAFYRYQRYMFRLFMALILNIKIVIHVILYKLLERI